jgi:hypothetical protein
MSEDTELKHVTTLIQHVAEQERGGDTYVYTYAYT